MCEAPDTKLALTAAHVARVERPVEGPLYRPEWRMLETADLDRLAADLTRGRPRPVSIFAYGSLIWRPDFEVGGRRRGIARGWHRRFSMSIDHFRGSPHQPGLMLALASGGSCEGLVLDIAEGTETQSLRSLLKRELVACELVQNAVWIEVETDRGIEEALTFFADPVGIELADLSLEGEAERLATANGPAGSGAGYLLNTVRGLESHGIHDPYMWSLQKLVAERIDRMAEDG